MVTKHGFLKDIEALFIELNFRKCKWLLCGLYHPPSQKDQCLFDNIGKALDVYSTDEKVILGGDFNSQIGENCIDTFLDEHNLQSVNKEPSCYKNPNNPSRIDLFLTNSPRSFYQTETLFTGLSDLHKLFLSIFKTTFTKSKAKEIIYRDFKKFNEQCFNNDLRTELSSKSIKSYGLFENIFLNKLNKHAPIKKNMPRANHAPYITTARRKGIMKRSYLENLYFKKRTPESMKKYKKQKNFYSKLYKKEQRRYFESFNPSKIVDNKTFWKNIQPLFSEKRKIANKVTLGDKEDKIISEDSLVSEEINLFFQNATKCLDIKENSYIKDESNEYTDVVEKAIYKYVNHPSILLIKDNIRGATPFLFKEASLEDTKKEMIHLNPKKVGAFQDIPPKILKNSTNVCSETLKKKLLIQ